MRHLPLLPANLSITEPREEEKKLFCVSSSSLFSDFPYKFQKQPPSFKPPFPINLGKPKAFSKPERVLQTELVRALHVPQRKQRLLQKPPLLTSSGGCALGNSRQLKRGVGWGAGAKLNESQSDTKIQRVPDRSSTPTLGEYPL